nr:hypothetical protein [Paracoccaceae bacterium]MCY4197055.1 hypothetical protein [Paracoccaceae bacterium]
MSMMKRRRFIGGIAAMSMAPAVAVAAPQSRKFAKLDAMANSATHFMIKNIPATSTMIEEASGFMIIPVVTQGALLFGAAVGDGVLRVGGKTVAYYQSVQLNVGLQVSVNQFSQAVFFLNDGALDRFRHSNGWKFGAGMRYVVVEDTQHMNVDTLTQSVDVAGLTFGDSGLHIGVSIDGTKFTPLSV